MSSISKSRYSSSTLVLLVLLMECIFTNSVFANAAKVNKNVDEIIVTSEKIESKEPQLGLDQIEISSEELTVKMGATLGETLENEIGVHNASYGPGVGLPVLRGLSGVRVHLSEDGIGAWDASSLSPDHATAVEAVIADSIQIIKGPASVLYGNNAIGGVVKVNNGRIAESLDENRNKSIFVARKELVNDHERESYAIKLRDQGRFSWQLDGFSRKSRDISIPGLAIQEEDVAYLYGISQVDNTFENIFNSDAEAESGSLGLSFIDGGFFIGASATLLENEYGIPPGAHTEPADSPGHNHSHPVGGAIAAAGRVRIDLDQKRYSFKTGHNFEQQLVEKISLSAGLIDYEHEEFELGSADGEVYAGTQFTNDVLEVNLEINHHLLSFLTESHSATWGLQFIDREFAARSQSLSGGEDFVPPTDQQSFSAFLYESLPFERGKFELGARYEHQKITQRDFTALVLIDDGSQNKYFHEPITYRNYTLSSALSFDLTENQLLTLNLSSAQRAPEIQELLSAGPHLATRSYDQGLLIEERDEPPPPEQFDSVELRWEYQSDPIGEIKAQVFYTEAEDFVYQLRDPVQLFDISERIIRNFFCARDAECIPKYTYTQADATLSGYEWQWFLPELDLLSGQLQIELFSDFVRAKLVDQGNLPRIPPRRSGIGLNWQNSILDASVRYTYASDQKKVGENELPTDSYELLNASLTATLEGGSASEHTTMLFIRIKNLLDKEVRKSSAFLRNFAPEPGREISAGLRYMF